MSNEQKGLRRRAVLENINEAERLLAAVAITCGNHHRRMEDGNDDERWSKIGMANAMLLIEPQIRTLLTGTDTGEIRS